MSLESSFGKTKEIMMEYRTSLSQWVWEGGAFDFQASNIKRLAKRVVKL